MGVTGSQRSSACTSHDSRDTAVGPRRDAVAFDGIAGTRHGSINERCRAPTVGCNDMLGGIATTSCAWRDLASPIFDDAVQSLLQLNWAKVKLVSESAAIDCLREAVSIGVPKSKLDIVIERFNVVC